MRRLAPLLALAVATLATTAVAETATYTNADLEKFGPRSETAPVPFDEAASWQRVNEFLEREQAKLDAARAAELARREVEIEEQHPRLQPPRYRLAYPVYGHVYPGHPVHPTYRIAIPQARPQHRPLVDQSQRLLGSDAFPSNRRRAEREASQ